MTQLDLIMEYFKNNPNREIKHAEIVDWLNVEWEKRTGRKFRDPDRGIRSLAQSGRLVKVSKGIYKYDPTMEHHRELEDFTPKQKEEILKRDGYKCVICGKGVEDGVELQIDHIKSKDSGGKATIENGQTLCGKHNYMKKNLNQTETGKKMFIRLYELAQKDGNNELESFCAEILAVFKKHNINGHIEWGENSQKDK